MNGMRWMTGLGIVVGGVGGAVAALMGAPQAPQKGAEEPRGQGVEGPALEREQASAVVATTPSSVPASASVAASAAASAPAPSAAPAARSSPTLEPPTSREALLKAQMICDQKKDFDECTRAALAFEQGSAGAADAQQAKRFRKIALTHLVMQCEGGSPHACFVLANKYRSGGELAENPVGADALEKRAAELCRFRAAPECPAK